MKIIAFGSPKAECRKCREAEKVVEEVLVELGALEKVEYRKLTLDSQEAAEFGVMATPTVVVDGVVVVDAAVPDREKLRSYLAGALG